MGNDGLVAGNARRIAAHRFLSPVRQAALDGSCRPGRPVAQRFDLLVLDEDGIGPEPVSVADRPVHHRGIAHPAEVGLRIGQQRNFVPVPVLDVIQLQERRLSAEIPVERMVLVRPGMAFTPEPVHAGIHVFHQRAPVEFLRQQRDHLFVARQEIGIVIPGNRLHLLVAHLAGIPFPSAFEAVHGHLLEQEFRQGVFQDVGIVQHDAESHPLAVFGGLLERNLPIVIDIEPSRPLLDMTPVGTDIDLGRQRKGDKLVNHLLQAFARHRRGAEIA